MTTAIIASGAAIAGTALLRPETLDLGNSFGGSPDTPANTQTTSHCEGILSSYNEGLAGNTAKIFVGKTACAPLYFDTAHQQPAGELQQEEVFFNVCLPDQNIAPNQLGLIDELSDFATNGHKYVNVTEALWRAAINAKTTPCN